MGSENDRDWETVYRDRPLSEIPWHSEKPPEFLVELLRNGEIKKGNALDICSGAGTNSVFLAKKGFEVMGVDISKTAVDYSRKRAQRAGVAERCNFISADVLELPFPRDRFDFAFDRGCYHGLSDEKKVEFVKKVFSALKPGGKYLLTVFSDKNPDWDLNVSKNEIQQNFSEFFKIGEIREMDDVVDSTGRKHDFYVILMTKK